MTWRTTTTGKTRKESGLSAKAAWLPPVQGLRDWRQDMSAEDIRVFEGIAGDLLRAIGYECQADACDEAVSARVQYAPCNGGVLRAGAETSPGLLVAVTQLHLAQPGLIRFFKCLARVEPSQYQLNIPGRHRAQPKDGIHLPTQLTVNAVGLFIQV